MVTIVKERIEPDIVILKVKGRLTLGLPSQELQWQIEELLAQHQKKLVLDLSELKNMDSTGLGIMVFCNGKLNESGGELRLACCPTNIFQLLKITKLDQVLSLHATNEEAVASFTSGEGTKGQPVG